MKHIMIFIAFITLGLTILFVTSEKLEFSDNENRYLEAFPEISFENFFEGDLTKKLENYVNDHFPLRNIFLSIKTRVELFLNVKEINGVYIGENQYLLEKFENPENTDKIIDILNNFHSNNQNVNMDLVLVPSSGLVNGHLLPKYVSFNTEKEMIDSIYSNVSMDVIDLYNPLVLENEENEVFFRLDHHYNVNGAYILYKEYMLNNNLKYNNLFNLNTYDQFFNGTLYSKTNIFSYEPDDFVYYDPKNELIVNYVLEKKVTNTLFDESFLTKKDVYSFYQGGNHSLIKIDTTVNNGEKILIIKDSYANSAISFFTNHYEEVHVVDLRFNRDLMTEYINDNDIENVLILYSSSKIDSDIGIKYLK